MTIVPEAFIDTKKAKFVTPDGRLCIDLVPIDANFILLRKIMIGDIVHWARIQFASNSAQAEAQIANLAGEISVVMLIECI